MNEQFQLITELMLDKLPRGSFL